MTESRVKAFFNGKNVFLTGGTGFVGIALVEKLLRTTNVNKVYLLLRTKKGKDISERLEEFKKNAIFERLVNEKGSDVFGKLVPVAGDVGEPNLGLSDSDTMILTENVNVMFHSAATLDFGANLKSTVQINLLGTRRVVELCKKIRHLNALLHVSSAFVNSHMLKPQEEFYPVHKTADEVIDFVEKSTDDQIEEKTKLFLGEYINTYTFTKALAEQEVRNASSSFPTCIVRPSMITASWKEPVKGWTNSKNGPQGFIMGAGKGVVRRLPVNENLIADYIPVDIVVNGMIVGAWHAATVMPAETPVFHLTSSTSNPFRWRLITPMLDELLHNSPLKSAVWYPCLKLVPSLFWFKVSALIFHWLPAYILDGVTKLMGGKTILVRMHTNIDKSLVQLKAFIFTEWLYDNKKTLSLHNSLNDEDKESFNLDVTSLDWLDYFQWLAKGVRVYLHNDPMSTVEKARKKDQMLRWFNLAIQGVFVAVVWFLYTMLTGTTFRGTLFMVPLVLSIISVL
ncbi:putative fatty acyl-CoA reductase CG8306 [Cimex lectularius]|uniref:Fatty acyl-CoA reductase n=1 Tax=Cimex lectularius TaxID=79782 RepID=A0A8I6RR95_CIMLE|nr:putative fatty acyl-CoA reductase CG8306 [Cimex lectularius]